MSLIHSVKTAVPNNYYTQEEVFDALAPLIDERVRKTFAKILSKTKIEGRYFCAPLDEVIRLCLHGSAAEKFKVWENTTYNFLVEKTNELLKNAGLLPSDIDGICSNSSTGFIIPGLDIKLVNDMGFNKDVKRIPFFGFGCVGGVAGINRVAALLEAKPKQAYLFYTVETLSLLMEFDKTDISHLVKSSLFGDGFGIVLMVGKEHPLASECPLDILGTKNTILPDSDDYVYQFMSDSGIATHIDLRLPGAVKANAAQPALELIHKHQLELDDIDYWVCHAGGPKIIGAISESFEMPLDKLDLSERIYSKYGNMSSVSVIFALAETLENIKSSGNGIMLAMGPGITLEYTLCKMRA